MTDYRIRAGEVNEDQMTASLEQFSTRFPSSFYLGAAVVSIIASLSLKIAKRDRDALFIGQWTAPFLLLGIYNKMVKQHGSDATTKHPDAM